ncbi:hypothetical protein [Clostridioides difficile]|uniref:hypothetical protein n=1 Tax=Clostridioides difficile TaxID=1496 RepID=UPI00137483A7|nr:hypothetical protein [Clostridioides difficile]HBG7256820.1 hypothetical protein [Clostridioides difficile]
MKKIIKNHKNKRGNGMNKKKSKKKNTDYRKKEYNLFKLKLILSILLDLIDHFKK